MRRLIKTIATTLGALLSLVCPASLPELWRAARTYFYTGFIRRRFARWGRGAVIVYRPALLRGLQHISVGDNTEIDGDVRLTAWSRFAGETFTPEIIIGANCHIGSGAHITAVNRIVIGDNLLTGTNVLITDNAHGEFEKTLLDIHPQERPPVSKGEVHIGNNVWLGSNVCIMPGVSIGNGAIVAANSVVTHDVPACSVAAGAPARVVKQIAPE